MKRMTILSLMLITLTVESNDQLDRQKETYDTCVSEKKCIGDGKSLEELNEKDKHEAYHCRVKRHLDCLQRAANE